MSIGESEKVREDIIGILSTFQEIKLKEMEEVHFMSRFDMKYIFHRSQLPEILRQLKNDYKVLVIDKLPFFRYENLYFDTPELKSYHDHHNGRAVRHKVRFRKYSDSEKCYIELKLKTNKGLTEKTRLAANTISKELSAEQLEFLKHYLGEEADLLQPQISNSFSRITLVNEKDRERLTIDLLLHFQNGKSEKSLDELVIAEVKQEHPSCLSVFKKLMQSHRIFPTSISKYCLGTLLTHPGIKYNRFKPKLIILNKICNVID